VLDRQGKEIEGEFDLIEIVNMRCVHDQLFWEDLVAIKMARFVVWRTSMDLWSTN